MQELTPNQLRRQKIDEFNKSTSRPKDHWIQKIGYGIANITRKEIVDIKNDFTKYLLARRQTALRTQEDEIMYKKAGKILRKMMTFTMEEFKAIEEESKQFIGKKKYDDYVKERCVRIDCDIRVKQLMQDFRDKHFIRDNKELIAELFKATESINQNVIKLIIREVRQEKRELKKNYAPRFNKGEYKMLRVMNEFFETKGVSTMLMVLLIYEKDKKKYLFPKTND